MDNRKGKDFIKRIDGREDEKGESGGKKIEGKGKKRKIFDSIDIGIVKDSRDIKNQNFENSDRTDDFLVDDDSSVRNNENREEYNENKNRNSDENRKEDEINMIDRNSNENNRTSRSRSRSRSRSSAGRVDTDVEVEVEVEEEHYHEDISWLHRLLSIHRKSATSGKVRRRIFHMI